jgi:predicted nucleic acid-binding protein
MTSAPVVSNASPLIALEQIDHLELLEQLFGTVLIPPAVVHEVAPTVAITSNLYENMLRAAGEEPGPGV